MIIYYGRHYFNYNYSYIVIYYGIHLQFRDPEADIHLGTYCGSNAFSVQSSSNVLDIIFQSDFSGDSNHAYSGFVLSWKCKFILLYLKKTIQPRLVSV